MGPEPRSEDLPPPLPSASPQLSIDTSFLEKTLYLLAQMAKAGSQRVLATQDSALQLVFHVLWDMPTYPGGKG